MKKLYPAKYRKYSVELKQGRTEAATRGVL